MKKFVVLAAMAVFAFVLCGCPQTAPPVKPSQTTLMDKYKGEGDPAVTVLHFVNRGCPVKVAELLRGVENLSKGTVHLVEVSGDEDREGKEAYAVKAYPTTLFFAEGELKRREEGSAMTFEEAKQIVVDLGATIEGVEPSGEAKVPTGEEETEATEETEETEGEGDDS